MSGSTEDTVKHKIHRERNAGRKAEKKRSKEQHVQQLTDKQKNPKAFTFNSAVRAERRFRRKQDIDTKKQHVPLVDRTPLEPPPVLVAVAGPPKVGKSLLIRCLVKSYAKLPLTSIFGPVTVVSGKRRRITFVECNNDINSMIDIAKVADLVLLLVDASFGFEMEIFEFLNICQVHGMPRIMGVLTHLDLLKNARQLRKTKKSLKQRFWTEVYAGAKLFYLSGMIREEYLRTEIKNLARFISVMKFRPLTWRSTHPYILVDRAEDLTAPDLVRQNPKVDRTISLYGYVRGVPLNKQTSVHIPGCGDLKIKDVSFLPDPCPLPERLKKRALVEKERLIYAPFSGVGGIVYDKDAVYVELGGSHSYKEEDTGLVGALMETRGTLDEKLRHSELRLFSDAAPIKSEDVREDLDCRYSGEIVNDNGRIRRRVVFSSGNDVTAKEALGDTENDDDDFDDFDDTRHEESSDEDTGRDDDDNDNVRQPNTAKGIKRGSAHSAVGQMEKRRRRQSDSSETEEDLVSENQVGHGGQATSDKQTEKFEEYRPLSNRSDVYVKAKIAEALNRLNVNRDEKTSTIDIINDESFDELSDGDSRTDLAMATSETERVVGLKTNFDNVKFEEIEGKDRKDEREEEEEVDEDEDEDEDELKWKTNLADKAREEFIKRRQSRRNLMKLVYGVFEETRIPQQNDKGVTEGGNAEEENIGGIFRVVQEQQKQKLQERELQNRDETVYFSGDGSRDWLEENNKVLLIDRFVTGQWKESEDAEELLRLDDTNEEEVYGDFEDLETGEKHSSAARQLPVDEAAERQKLAEKKRKLKERFDTEYDNSEGSKSYYDELKLQAEKQSELNRAEFEGVDDEVRVELEGYRPGMYVRVEIEAVPCEMITNLDPTYPLIIGGLLHGEENIGYVQARMKKHRWYSKILKSRDPLILSVGWRRFQTLAIFSKLEDNLRNRMLKYTPEHVACMAHFWGPVTPQGTGVLAVQDVSTRPFAFRIAATGSIVETDQTTRVVKKLKLTGVPLKIYKKTAFVKDMFTTALEVAKFEGAKIRTVSGIRGQIKKAVSKPQGCFRATFEDKILLSDIVFCRTWYKVDVPKFYNPVTSLLLPPEEKAQWRGMRTVGQLKRERNIRAEPEADSLYAPIERDPVVFKPLSVPRRLQQELPYRDKPKPTPRRRDPLSERGRVAVVREPKEERVARLMKMIRTNYAHKQDQLKEATKRRMEIHQARIALEEARKANRQKEAKRQIFRELGKLEKKNNKRR